jgi:hypothetical protein
MKKAQIKTKNFIQGLFHKPMNFIQAFICSCHSQIKMFETIAILVVFFFIILFGFMFYSRIQESTFQAELEEKSALKTIEMAEKISFLPEIQCSRDNIPEEDCIDLLKLDSAAKIINDNSLAYFDIFGYSYIHVDEIYPSSISWSLYNFSKKEDLGKISIPFPVSLYNTIDDKYSFGVLYIDIYR